MYSSRQIPIGQWKHLAGTWNGTNLVLYLNGVLDRSATLSLPTIGNSGCPFSIGGMINSYGYSGQYFPGQIDEVSLYDRALLAGEINAIYLTGVAGKCKTLPGCATFPLSAVASWPGEGDVTDMFNINPGTLQNGVSFDQGMVGGAFKFNGSQQAVEIPSNPALLTTPFSVEAWVKPAARGSGSVGQAFVYGQCYGRQLVVRNGFQGLRVAFIIATSRISFYEVDSSGDIPIGKWTHLVGTYDGSVLSLYINGALDQRATVNITPWDSGCPFHIGGIYDPSGGCAYTGQYFNGLIDEVTCYSQALAAADVSALYNAGGAGKCADADQDGLPDWWEIKYFGDLAQGPTGDYDWDGTLNIDEFNSGADPNKIRFAVSVANQYVNSASVPIQLNVSGGVAWSMAVLLDSTNFAAANWTAYNPPLTVNLGTREGWHEVWVGLRGRPDGSQQSWSRTRLKLDVTPPLLVVTNPPRPTVSVPLLQLQGYSPEALQNISYDLANSAGVATDQDAGVTAQFYDTNTLEFTTNYFECLDVPLTDGLNTITIHASDLAGNTTTVTFSITLDYSSRINPPVVKLYWPQDGTLIANSTYTWRGWVDDPMAAVTAQLVDPNGDTNLLQGLVERDGKFWVENIPLTDGANALTLTVTDSAGNVAVTNILVYPGTVDLSIDTPPSDQLWNTTVTVNGAISDSANYTVWVNGRKAHLNGDQTWTATNVYLPAGGTALIQARAIPHSDSDKDGNGTGGTGGGPTTYDNLGNPASPAASNAESQANKPERLYVQMYLQPSSTTSDYWHDTDWYLDGTLYDDLVGKGDTCCDYNWTDGSGGSGSDSASGSVTGYSDGVQIDSSWSWTSQQTWPPSSWPFLVPGTQTASGDYDWPNFGPNIPPPSIYLEHCNISFPINTVVSGALRPFYETYLYWDSTENYRYTRIADVQYMLETGGKGLPGRRDLWNLSASATQWIPRAEGPKSVALDSQPISSQSIIIDGKRLGSDGQLWRTYAQCDTRDVTVHVPGVDYFTFNLLPQKYHPHITLIDTCTSPTSNLDTDTPEVCVGDLVYLSLDWDITPPTVIDTQQRWKLPPKLVNEFYEYSANCTSYRLNTDLWTNNPTWCWYVNKPGGRVLVWQSLHFSNGQYATIAADGNFTVYRPSIELEPLTPDQQDRYYTIDDENEVTCFLKLGENDESGKGTMRFVVDIRSKYSGAIGLTQLITADYSDWLGWVFSDERCDRGEWYSGPNDFPGGNYSVPNGFVSLDDGPNEVWVTPNIVSLSARDFVRFTPSCGIPVTLGILTWETVGVAQELLGSWPYWEITEDETTGPDGPDSSDEFPKWTINQGGQ